MIMVGIKVIGDEDQKFSSYNTRHGLILLFHIYLKWIELKAKYCI